MSYGLTDRVWLYEPGTITRGDLGHETRPYTRHFTHARLTIASGSEQEALGLITPDDRRRYIVRWRSGLSTKWFLRDSENEWFQVESVAPLVGARKRSFVLLIVSSVTDPNLTEA